MPDTRWIQPMLDWMLYIGMIPRYPIEWVGVDHETKEITLIKFRRTK